MPPTANVRMHITRGRRTVMGSAAGLVLVVASATALAQWGPAAASSSPTVVVHGTDFPDPARAGLSLVGCDGMYDVAPETPQPMIGQGPGDAPLGARSLAYDLAGGNAIGPAFRVGSIASVTTASVTVHPWVTASTGVGYVAYADSEGADPGRIWVGRTSLTAPGGGWTTIDVADRSFSWTRYDASTLQVTGRGPDAAVPISDFVAQHGDGPGVVAVGFGCNGVPFNLDDLRISSSDGSTTYDLEGLTTSVEMSHHATESGETTLVGQLHGGNGAPLAGATLRLERAESPDGPWRTVGAFAVHDGVASTTVQPEDKTWYRWRFVDRPLASGSTSPVIVVDGSTDGPTDGPTATATASPSDHPTQRPSESPSQTPSSSSTPSATESATDRPSESASTDPTPTQSAAATGSPSDQPSPTSSDPKVDPTGSPSDSDAKLDQPTSSAG